MTNVSDITEIIDNRELSLNLRLDPVGFSLFLRRRDRHRFPPFNDKKVSDIIEVIDTGDLLHPKSSYPLEKMNIFPV